MIAVNQYHDHDKIKEGRKPYVVWRHLPEFEKETKQEEYLHKKEKEDNTKSAENHVNDSLFSFFKQSDIFINFTKGLEDFREKVRKLALEIKERQGSVGVYGASVGGVMMVYHLGLSDVIDYFLDDNIAKIGKYASNLGVLVNDSKILEEDTNIKEVINVAWRFIDPITQKHKEFLKRGGIFYNLELPQLEIKEYLNGTN